MKQSIHTLFSMHGEALCSAATEAKEAEALIDEISPLIEAYTSVVCPHCSDVCCIDRHSRFDQSDMIFMAARGNDLPEDDAVVPDTAPCKFLGKMGCTLRRTLRPYRCTWFFCSPLLDHIIHATSASEYRKFMKLLEDISVHRTAMIAAYEAASSDL